MHRTPSRTGYFALEVRLTITAGHFGVFGEPELITWLRAVSGHPGKVLVVQPLESLDLASDQTRTFKADERSLAPERVSALVDLLTSLGFPGRVLELEDTSDPESIWWAKVTLEVAVDDCSSRLEFGLGPDGVRGRDATDAMKVFRALFQFGAIRSSWSELLGGRADPSA